MLARFVANAEAVVEYPARFTPNAVRLAQDLIDAVELGDSLEAKSLVLEIDRLNRSKAWSV
jgi:hypothetical protein